MTVGRPTDAEFDMMERLIDDLFVKDTHMMEVKCWRDGDVHITAMSTLGTNTNEGYPIDVKWHRQNIVYRREMGKIVYTNVVERMDLKPDKTLDRREIPVDLE